MDARVDEKELARQQWCVVTRTIMNDGAVDSGRGDRIERESPIIRKLCVDGLKSISEGNFCDSFPCRELFLQP
jgi:hypothetical protein